MALSFDTKTPDAVRNLGADFTALLAQLPAPQTIVSCACSITQTYADTAPGALTLVGSPTVTGNVVTQKVSGGLVGAVYTLEFEATLSNGEVMANTIDLPVGQKAPA